MTQFRARIRPTLSSAAQELVGIYESTPGSTGPGCCPEALAAVLDRLAGFPRFYFEELAAQLRGEQP